MSPQSTSISFYCSLELKARIDAAAALDERSVSQYLVRLLSKIVPPGTPSPQLDIETLIEKQNIPSNPYRAQTKRITKELTGPKAKRIKK